MTSILSSSLAQADEAPLLGEVLEKNQEVKDKIEECAFDLSCVNKTVRKEMAAGITLQQAEKALAQNEYVRDKVLECASNLQDVNEALTQQVKERNKLNRELIETGRKLSAAKNILSNMGNTLTEAYKVAEEAKQRSLHDFLTGIPNRELFNEYLEKAIALANRCDWILAVMFIDLDRFKLINDTHGHATGDKVLQVVAERLQEELRNEDAVCRYGSDEFLCLLVNPQNAGNIQHIVSKVFDRISQTIYGLTVTIEPSIGIALYPGNGSTGEELVANANYAMYHAKNRKAGYIFFDDLKDHPDGI